MKLDFYNINRKLAFANQVIQKKITIIRHFSLMFKLSPDFSEEHLSMNKVNWKTHTST